ncbi:LysR family transcriptional regulator [Kutzneria viridogrisea]|uniref:LysR family transcription regulator n=2 Tax=Kutzneria TaxID=43356 RepID=W5W9W0_9PSEU|nr:LysR family transcription regulator [Kutzneria albida DSM 43870]
MEYLLAVVEDRSFTRAAERLLVSQPALSQQIRALEREVGGELLERLTRDVRLTPMGRAYLPHAQAAVSSARRARSAARAVGGLDEGELQIATVHSVALGVLPAALHVWRRDHPGVELVLREFSDGEELAAQMALGVADVAIGPRPSTWDGPVRSLGHEEFVAVLPSGLLPGGGPLRLSELDGHDWVLFDRSNGLSTAVDEAFAAAGVRPGVAIRTQSTATALRLAASGMGPVLVPGNVVPTGLAADVRRLDPPWLRELVAYSRVRPTGPVAEFAEVLAEHGTLVQTS